MNSFPKHSFISSRLHFSVSMLLVMMLYAQEGVMAADTSCVDCSAIPTDAGLIPSSQLNDFTLLLGLGLGAVTSAVVGVSNGGVPPAPSNNAFALSPVAVVPLISEEQPDATTERSTFSLDTMVMTIEINPNFSNGGSLIGPAITPPTTTAPTVVVLPTSNRSPGTSLNPVNPPGNGGTIAISTPGAAVTVPADTTVTTFADTTVTVPAVSCSTTTITVEGTDIVGLVNVGAPNAVIGPTQTSTSCSLDVIQYQVTSTSYGWSVQTSVSTVVVSSTVQTTLYSSTITFVAPLTLLCTNTLYYYSTMEIQSSFVTFSYTTLMVCLNALIARFVEGDERLVSEPNKIREHVPSEIDQNLNGATSYALGYAHLAVLLVGVILWF